MKKDSSREKENKAVLYTAPFCPKCSLAKSALTQNKYIFDESQDTEKAVSLGIKVAPCLVMPSGKQYGLKEILQICKGEGQFE